MPDFNELVKNLYTSKNRELTQEKLDYINKNYVGKEEDFVKNFYATIGEDLPEEKFNYIRDTYLGKKKVQSTPSFSTNLGDFTQPLQVGAEKPSINQSPLASNLKLASEKKQINPFTASKEELTQVYGEDYSREKQLVRQKNYTQGLERLSKRVETLLPQYEKQVTELDNLDNQLKTLEQNPNEYNQLLQVRNQKVNDVIKLADNLRAEKVKADIYEKGLSATDLLRRSKEDTLSNRIQSGLNSLGIMATTTLPAIARGAKLVESYAQAKAMGLSAEDTDLYNRAQAEISKQNWKGLTNIAREFYDKNQILEGGFSKESGFEKIKQGDYKAAGGLLAKELLQNLPVTLGIGLTFANPLLGATYTIGGTAGMELQDMDINNPNMSEQAKIANAFVKGGSEYVTEKIFGTFNYLGRIAGGSIKSEAGKKMLFGSVKEAYEQVAKRLGLGADVIEEVSTEVLNKLVGDYADYKSGKTTELEFKKGLGETITTALSTSLLLGGAGRAGKYGYKKIDELRNKAKELQNIAANPEVKPEIANAAKEEVLNVNEQIGNEAEKAQAKYNAMPEETQNKVDELVAEKTQTEQLLQEPELPKEIIPSLEAKLETIQTEIDNTYSEIKPKEKTIEEKISEAETTITPSSSPSSEVSAPNNVEGTIINTKNDKENTSRLQSNERKGQEPIEAKFNETTSGEKVETSGVLQAPKEEVKSNADYNRINKELIKKLGDAMNKRNKSEVGTDEYAYYQSEVEKADKILTDFKNNNTDLILEHGTPHDFDKFQLEKIGTGEGHQAFGHGLYFTENSKIAQSYAEKLSKDKEGIIYQVKIKDGRNKEWLEWRDALDDSQAEKISSIIKSKKSEYDKYLSENQKEEAHTGAAEQLFNENLSVDERPLQVGAIYSDLKDAFGQQEATKIMQEAGFDGVKYKTKGGRGEDFNYVIFDPKSIIIENKKVLPAKETFEPQPTKPKTNETEKTEISKAEPSSETKSPTSSKGKEKVNPTTQKVVEQILNKEVNEKGELPNVPTRKNKRETALKEVAESLDAKEKVAVEHIVKNLDLIREKLLEKGLIETNCSWSAK